jgi:hypothetical protein
MICGRAGTGKSYQFQETHGVNYYAGDASAIGIYEQAYLHRAEALCLDDIEDILGQRAVTGLFKTLAATGDKPRTVTWTKQNRVLAAKGIPDRFVFEGRICIICNEFPGVSKSSAAVYDRAEVIIFDPPNPEVHRHVGTFWSEQHRDVYDFIGGLIQRVDALSIRLYEKAVEKKLRGRDWRQWLMARWERVESGDPLLAIAREILLDKQLKPGEPKESAWIKKTGMSRAAYYIHQRKAQRILGVERGRWATAAE